MATTARKQTKKAWEEACERIEQLILDAQLSPGELITENDLAERLGLSRTPVREAIKKLEEKGLILSYNGRKRVHMLTIREMEEVFDIKIYLEGQVVRRAIERGSESDFSELAVIMAEMRLFVDAITQSAQSEELRLQEWLEIDRSLHRLLFKMAGTPKTERIIQGLNMQWHRLKVGSLTLEGRMQRSIQEHERFVRAILERDPDTAEQAIKAHLDTIKREMIKLMGIFQYPA